MAKRIVDEAMANMQSDRKIMENAVDTNTKLDKRGQLIAGLLCFTCVILAALCLFLIPNAAIAVPGAGIFGLAAIAPVVNSFLERGGTGGKNNSGDEKDQ